MNFTYTLSVEDVYETANPNIPEGWEAIDFRATAVGEFCLPVHGLSVYGPCIVAGRPAYPRLILRPKNVRKIIFTEIRRDSQPEKGDWFLDSSGRYGQWTTHEVRGFYFPPTTIYRREEVEE